ncbi:hypothetical protein L596_007579 [Steinernema carpocapsae]|uniref:MADF domain-containing protein n=1 Tax=Steinernema carpocapsae TaxID=34508 RepID=A0A4U5P9R6_STECR|nr:hypothetical protein L596_007579 [Steinernema carpocapsae]
MEGEPLKKRGRKSNPDRKSLGQLYGEQSTYQLINILRNYPALWTTRVVRAEEWRPVITQMKQKYPDMEEELIRRTWLNLLNGFIYRPERWKWRSVMSFVSSSIIPKYVEEAQNDENVSSSMQMQVEDSLNGDGINEADSVLDDDDLGTDDGQGLVYNHMVNGVNNISYYPNDGLSQNGGASSSANNIVYEDSRFEPPNPHDSQLWQMYEPQLPMASAPLPQSTQENLQQQMSMMANTLNDLAANHQAPQNGGGIDKLLAVLAQGMAPPKYCFGEMIRDRMEAIKSPLLRWQAERRILEAVDEILDNSQVERQE